MQLKRLKNRLKTIQQKILEDQNLELKDKKRFIVPFLSFQLMVENFIDDGLTDIPKEAEPIKTIYKSITTYEKLFKEQESKKLI